MEEYKVVPFTLQKNLDEDLPGHLEQTCSDTRIGKVPRGYSSEGVSGTAMQPKHYLRDP